MALYFGFWVGVILFAITAKPYFCEGCRKHKLGMFDMYTVVRNINLFGLNSRLLCSECYKKYRKVIEEGKNYNELF